MEQWFRGFADRTRLQILAQLSEAGGELPAWDFALRLVQTVSAVNHHLHRLCETGLVASRQDGRRRVYRLAGAWVAELLQAALRAATAEKGKNPVPR
jgi:DNA-binding transcriptional ArsR family regulator